MVHLTKTHVERVAEEVQELHQCQAAGVPFFFKQWGGFSPNANGRMLDGRAWSELPSVAETSGR